MKVFRVFSLKRCYISVFFMPVFLINDKIMVFQDVLLCPMRSLTNGTLCFRVVRPSVHQLRF
jgi:hypothetical protein